MHALIAQRRKTDQVLHTVLNSIYMAIQVLMPYISQTGLNPEYKPRGGKVSRFGF